MFGPVGLFYALLELQGFINVHCSKILDGLVTDYKQDKQVCLSCLVVTYFIFLHAPSRDFRETLLVVMSSNLLISVTKCP